MGQVIREKRKTYTEASKRSPQSRKRTCVLQSKGDSDTAIAMSLEQFTNEIVLEIVQSLMHLSKRDFNTARQRYLPVPVERTLPSRLSDNDETPMRIHSFIFDRSSVTCYSSQLVHATWPPKWIMLTGVDIAANTLLPIACLYHCYAFFLFRTYVTLL